MRRTILLSGVLPFVSAFLGGALAFNLMAAPQAAAQSSQAQEVSASAFVLVGADGTTLARLGPGDNGGGNLSLFDPAGTRRLAITSASGGAISTYRPDGVTVTFRAGAANSVNGVLLGPDGSISMIPPSP